MQWPKGTSQGLQEVPNAISQAALDELKTAENASLQAGLEPNNSSSKPSHRNCLKNWIG